MERSDAKVAKGVFAPLADTWLKKGVEVTHALWRRLSVVVDAFADAGLLIEKVGEPHSTTRPGNRFLRRGAIVEGRPTSIAYLSVSDPRPADPRSPNPRPWAGGR